MPCYSVVSPNYGRRLRFVRTSTAAGRPVGWRAIKAGLLFMPTHGARDYSRRICRRRATAVGSLPLALPPLWRSPLRPSHTCTSISSCA